ncbi:MAG TPA: hypothetical protein VLH77_04100, partial [Gammaproteobacteria bacterium]|nr:hypothetical protein [Gammaproteobacteria bacterium]
QQQPVYNGTLFKWAYLMPELREEVYPFEVNHLQEVPDLVLYDWLQHADNIFCVGYDANAQWHDRSVLFRKNLALEKRRRGMVVNNYESLPATTFEGQAAMAIKLALPLPQLCQMACDQNKHCQGFTYLNKENTQPSKCLFYNAIGKRDKLFCASCEAYVKK